MRKTVDVLGDDGDLLLVRDWAGDGSSSLAATLTGGATPAALDRLRSAVAISRALPPDRFVRATGLVERDGRAALLMEDPGGTLLSAPGEPAMDLERAIAIGIDGARSLAAFHALGLVHCDVRPEHFLVESGRGVTRLLGFGRSVPASRASAAGIDRITARMAAYMAPERSGRANAPIDARSDLYSFGVVLFEMIAGSLPFRSRDVAEALHAHMAKTPERLDCLRPDLPKVIADVVDRLLAKHPDQRYQTAMGLAGDLVRCLEVARGGKGIPGFAPGADDFPTTLAVPAKLHGRDDDIARLMERFRSVVATGSPGLVLLSAPAGMGKSSVVAEMKRELASVQALFVSGKGDQYRRDVPFGALAQALSQLAKVVLACDAGAFARWQERLHIAMADDGALVAMLAPEFERVVGAQPPLADLPPSEARTRLRGVFRRLIAAFADEGSPLVLFMDDLQWLDVETMALLVDVVADDFPGQLFVIGAYRDGAWAEAPAVRMRVDALRSAGSRGVEVTLGPLAMGPTMALVAEVLRQEPSDVATLAALVHRRTGGNPFFAVQFLTALGERGLLVADPVGRVWTWDDDQVAAHGFTDDVVSLMVSRLDRLAGPTRLVLGRLASFGAPADADRLAAICALARDEVDAALLEAERADLVRLTAEGRYAFAHDRIEEAAYALVPPSDRRHVHASIGRTLLAAGGAVEDDDVFDIVNQFNHALDLVADRDERLLLARLNLAAGHRARASSAFAAAQVYFAAATDLFRPDGWATDRRGAFEAEFHLAEAEIYAKVAEEPARRLAALAAHVATLQEDAAVTCQRAALSSSLGRHGEALDLGLAFLARVGVGVDWPRRPPPELVRAEEERAWAELDCRSPAQLLALPLLEDEDQGAVMSVLTVMMVPALFIEPTLLVLVVARCIRLTFAHGNSDASAMAYAMAAIAMVSVSGRQAVGSSFSELAVDLVERRGLRLHRTKVYVMAAHVLHWTKSPRVLADMGDRARLAGAETGDVLFGSYGAGQVVTAALALGSPLAEIEQLARRGLAQIGNEADVMVPQILAQLNVVLALRGDPLDFGIYGSQQGFDETFDREGNRHHIIVQWTSVRRLERAVFMGDATVAVEAADRALAVARGDIAYFEWAECQFYGAVARAMLLDRDGSIDRGMHIGILARHVQLLESWVALQPATFTHRHALALAELRRLEDRPWEAQQAYREAIDAARAHGCRHHEALAHERAARFFSERGFDESALAHLRAARLGYLQWGATAKVAALDRAAPTLASELSDPAGADSGDTVERLDLATVLKVSSALAGEVSVDALVHRLLRIALEHAAAERATLVTICNHVAAVEAEASFGADGVEVSLFRAGDEAPAIPETVVKYVMRTGELLLLSDAASFGMFATDPHFAAGRPQSVLALPMMRQGGLAGIILLENRLAAGAFGAARLSVLKLVASEAAAALENARLYGELNQALEEASRARETAQTTIDAIPAMICVSSPDGVVEFMSENWTEYSGFTNEDMKGRGWVASVHPEDQKAMIGFNVAQVASGNGGAIEARLRRYDGAYRWFRVDAKPMRDAEGRVTRWYGTIVDIHDTRTAQASLRELEAQLEQVSRVAAFGELTASIAHEVNQPLAAVLTNAETGLRWLSSAVPDVAEASAVLERIRGNAERMNEVILRLRRLFVRGEEDAREAVDLNAAVQETAVFIRPELSRGGVTFEMKLSADPLLAMGNRVALQQVMLNLLTNAVQAVAACERRSVTVSTRRVDGSAEVEVRDTGVGMAGLDVDALFASFRTTKPDGMGLGLSISRTIIESHGGRISGENSPDGGAVFRFTLPGA